MLNKYKPQSSSLSIPPGSKLIVSHVRLWSIGYAGMAIMAFVTAVTGKHQ